MKYTQKKSWTFEELSPNAQKVAIMEKQKKINNEMDWANYIIEDFIDSARFLGFTINKIMIRDFVNFNVNDGVAMEGTFKASEIALDKLRMHAPSHNGIYRLSGYFKEILEQDKGLTAEFKHNGDKTYFNASTMLYFFTRAGKKVTNANTALSYIHELENHIFHKLHGEWNYRNNREYVVEEILEDENFYDNSGNIIKV